MNAIALPDIFEADIAGRTVLVRADLNVPMHHGVVTDATRIIRFAPTVAALQQRGAKVVVLSHLGRPKGTHNPVHSLAPVANALSQELDTPVRFGSDCVGGAAEAVSRTLEPGSVAMLENLRFHEGEEANDRAFAYLLSANGDIFVNDAFSCSHRAHASTDAITRLMPSYAGPSLLAEVEALTLALDDPDRPVAAVVGGAKVSTKIDILTHLVSKVDFLIIGGGMANTFLAAFGHDVGRSLYEPDALATARRVLVQAQKHNCEVVLPNDLVVARDFAANAPSEVAPTSAIPSDAMALDIGPASLESAIGVLERCRTLLWNGPLGAFEIEPFGRATFALAQAAAGLTAAGRLLTVAGGGDTAAALGAAGVADRFTYLSTAGGAFLEWLEGKQLPGIAALTSPESAMENI
ncbi:phosphoglycerate kinase [Paradevosia shaoguanensis]|uniref:phosphoglycerate kinase n=1 Tax=Paradevosia shaoguanensis TaxID=1335043 RepID=UPI0019345903|nr:phosphoglycerate kinase [Paradevosia shaoguanensis]